MVVIRCTQKLLRRIGTPEPTNIKSTARLGDWSAHLIGVAQRRFVLLVSEPTRLPVLVRAADVRNLARNFPKLLVPVLVGLTINRTTIEREVEEMKDVAIAPTNNRSVLGSVNDFARQVKWRLYDDPEADLVEVSLRLSETPIMIPFGGESPQRLVRKLLA